MAAVLNLYWDLVSFHEDVVSRKHELETAQLLLEDNKKQVTIGALAEIEVTRAESQLYAAQQDLVISETNLLQQEIVLKNASAATASPIPRWPPYISSRSITIPAPGSEALQPTEQLVQQAINKRVEIAQGRINLESNRLNLIGIKNSLKPTLNAFAELTNNALTGVSADPSLAYLEGGYGNLLAQIARRNFPNYSAGLQLANHPPQPRRAVRLRHQLD